jgi:hypothetical protein
MNKTLYISGANFLVYTGLLTKLERTSEIFKPAQISELKKQTILLNTLSLKIKVRAMYYFSNFKSHLGILLEFFSKEIQISLKYLII